MHTRATIKLLLVLCAFISITASGMETELTEIIRAIPTETILQLQHAILGHNSSRFAQMYNPIAQSLSQEQKIDFLKIAQQEWERLETKRKKHSTMFWTSGIGGFGLFI